MYGRAVYYVEGADKNVKLVDIGTKDMTDSDSLLTKVYAVKNGILPENIGNAQNKIYTRSNDRSIANLAE